MKILIVLLLSGFTAFGQGDNTPDWALKYKCTVAHKDGICPWDILNPPVTTITTLPVIERGIWQQADTVKQDVYLICSLKGKISSVFSSPAILVQGVYLIRRRSGKYVPVPKTWKILTVIK